MDITWQGLALGILGVVVGLGLVFRGFRLFLLLLPLLGFVGGFLVGAGLVEELFGDGFLATLVGWVAGFGFGLVMAVLSYLYYWLAVGVLGGFIGYQLPTVLAIVGTALAGAALVVAGATLALGLAPHTDLRDGVVGIYSSQELGWVGIVTLIVLSLGGMVYQARALTPDDEVISPASFRNPGLGGGGGAATA